MRQRPVAREARRFQPLPGWYIACAITTIRRREFIGTLGGAARASPLTARGQQQSAMPVIGLGSLPQTLATPFAAWSVGEIGFVEGQNVL